MAEQRLDATGEVTTPTTDGEALDDDLDGIEFLIDDIEDQIAPLAL